jgi:hypothetical protein
VTITRDDKKGIRNELRGLRYDLKVWTLKAPGLHFDEAIVCPEHRGRRRDGKPVLCEDGVRGLCEGCLATLTRTDRTDQLDAEIRTLTDRLNGRTTEPEPATRPAVVITGRGEQLVMFV